MVSAALRVALVYFIVYYCDMTILSWQCLTRPIVIAPLCGLALGDFKTGVTMGAALEGLYMGISSIGGATAADATIGTVIPVCYAVMTNASVEEAMAIAMPIGTVMASFSSLLTPLWAALAPFWEKLAAECNPKKFFVVNIAVSFAAPLVNTIILFFGVAYGVTALNGFLGSLPAWVLTGLGAASGMMLAVGYAILTSMIWSGETGIFFFVGYVLVAYGILTNTLAIAILGAAIAITMFMGEKRTIDLKKSLSAGATASNTEEDFF